MTPAAEKYLSAAVAGDPKQCNVNSSYEFRPWQQRKLVRPEAYFAKPLSRSGEIHVARGGLRDVQPLRTLAMDLESVEVYGDPVEIFDFGPPDDDNERRGVTRDE